MEQITNIKAKQGINFAILSGTYKNPKRFLQNHSIKALVPYRGRPMIVPVIEALLPFAKKIAVCGNTELLQLEIFKHIKTHTNKLIFVDENSDAYKKVFIDKKEIFYLNRNNGANNKYSIYDDRNDALNIIYNVLNASISLDVQNDYFFVLGTDIPDITSQKVSKILDDFNYAIDKDIKNKGRLSNFYISLGCIENESYQGLNDKKRPAFVLNDKLQIRIGNIHLMNVLDALNSVNMKNVFKAINSRKVKDNPVKSFFLLFDIFRLSNVKDLFKIFFNTVKYYYNDGILRIVKFYNLNTAIYSNILTRYFGYTITFVHTICSDDIDTDEEYSAKLKNDSIM